MEKILLHNCCAPCSPKVIENLESEFEVVGFWCNPNIHPREEYDKRRTSLVDYLRSAGKELISQDDYDQMSWEAAVSGLSGDARCAKCYEMRLEKAAETAKSMGIKYFTTTLLSSPHQKHELVRAVGEKAAKAFGVMFHYKDHRKDYYMGKDIAYKLGSYMQKYCGCLFSKEDRKRAKK